MLNYEIDPDVLRPLVPRGTELDAWNGKVFVSVVGFHFRDTKMLGLAIPFHRHFPEVNLRFYVRREVGPEVRRGVVFIKEIVPRFAISFVANALYNEKYVTHRMHREDTPGRVSYAWDAGGRRHSLALSPDGELCVPGPDSEESFIAEHYWGYTAQRDGSTLEYRVEHPPWAVQRGKDPALDCDVAGFYGATYAPFLRGTPSSCFLADGSAVVVRKGVRLG
jgi:uncharacterized protein